MAIASALGTTVEYYDFTLYATTAALVFDDAFFPSASPVVGTLAAFSTFFVGYLARPVGGSSSATSETGSAGRPSSSSPWS
ncbi:hypothetical protein NKH77_49285 [Streptomyces sp. M19]